MKKVGIISLNINTDDLNYGAVLHSYAFQKYLQKHNVKSEIIDYITPMLENKNIKHPEIEYLKRGNFKFLILSLIRMPFHLKKYNRFRKFIDEKMVVSEKKYTKEILNNEVLSYDILVCESDVIWSPGFFNNSLDETFFLGLESMKDKIKIAYSPSAGNGVNEDNKELFIRLVKRLDAVSCRESYTVDFIKENTSLNVLHVLDPVFLLSKDDYTSIMSRRLIKDKYCLIYFPLEYNGNMIKEIKKYAKIKKLKVVELSRYPWEIFRHKTFLSSGIEDFLSLIYYSEIVFSNSFHASAFSIIFNKEFYVYNRKNGLKMKDLCKTFELNDRFVYDSFEEKEQIDWHNVNIALNEIKKTSEQFIINNIIKIAIK